MWFFRRQTALYEKPSKLLRNTVANLKGANFGNTNLEGAKFDDADIEGASFWKAKGLSL